MPKVGMKEIRKKEVIEATIRCIEEKGMNELTIKSIAHEAKVSTGIIYHYFNNKDQLLLAVLKHVFAKSDIDVMEIVEPIKSPKKKMIKHIERMMATSKENPQLPTIQFAYYGQALNNPGIRSILNKFISNLLAYIRSYLKNKSGAEELAIEDIDDFAIILLSVAFGTGLIWTLKPGCFDLDSTIKLFQKVVCKYIKI